MSQTCRGILILSNSWKIIWIDKCSHFETCGIETWKSGLVSIMHLKETDKNYEARRFPFKIIDAFKERVSVYTWHLFLTGQSTPSYGILLTTDRWHLVHRCFRHLEFHLLYIFLRFYGNNKNNYVMTLRLVFTLMLLGSFCARNEANRKTFCNSFVHYPHTFGTAIPLKIVALH